MSPLGDTLDGTKSLSRPHSMMKSNDMGKPYDDDRRKKYDDDDKRKPYDRDDDRRKPYDDDKRKPYDDDDDKRRPYDDNKSESHGQCSVENQHCCNQVNKASHIHSSYRLFRC